MREGKRGITQEPREQVCNGADEFSQKAKYAYRPACRVLLNKLTDFDGSCHESYAI